MKLLLLTNNQKVIKTLTKKNKTLLVGPSFSGKTYLMLNYLSRKPDQDIYIFIKSTLEQYSKSKIKIEEKKD